MENSTKPKHQSLLNPCADPTFKILFTDASKEAHHALTCFLCDILEKEVTDVVLQPNELSGEAISDKQSEFDINCKIDGQIANIEIQGKNDENAYGKRVEYHVAHILNHYTVKGTEWNEIPQVFQISVMNFNFDTEEKDCINHYFLRNKNGRPVSKILNVIFMELPKINKLCDDVSKLTKAQMWGKFFLYASKPEKAEYIQKLTQANGGIKMAFTVLKNISQDELNWQRETHYWMSVSDEATRQHFAIEKGKAEGKTEANIEAARNFFANGVSIDLIAKSLKMTLDEVREITKDVDPMKA